MSTAPSNSMTLLNSPGQPQKAARRKPEQTDLKQLAEDIKSHLERICDSYRRGLEHAREAGELLAQARKLVDHGEWQTWVEKYCGFSHRTAELYMQIAAHWSKIKSQADDNPELTINKAVALIRRARSDEAKSDSARLAQVGNEDDAGSVETPPQDQHKPDPVETAVRRSAANLQVHLHKLTTEAVLRARWAPMAKASLAQQLREVASLANQTAEALDPKAHTEPDNAAA